MVQGFSPLCFQIIRVGISVKRLAEYFLSRNGQTLWSRQWRGVCVIIRSSKFRKWQEVRLYGIENFPSYR